MRTKQTHPQTAGLVPLLGLAWCLAWALVSPASAAVERPSLLFRMVGDDMQIGTDVDTSYYLQWCTPMGEWKNWSDSTQIDPGNSTVWFRGVFENVQSEDAMDWNPPADVALYSAEWGGSDPEDLSWASIGKRSEGGLIQALAPPDPMSGVYSPAPVPDAAPKINQAVATPDPGRVRLYWQNTSTRQPVIWHLGDSGARKGGVTVASSPASAWSIAGTGDIDGDGVEDLIWHNSGTGRVVVWFLDPDGVLNRTQAVLDANLATTWSLMGVEDMNQDGVPDLIWHQSTTGRAHVWSLGADGKYVSGWDVSATYPATAWKIAGVADMNRDGNPDLVWHHGTTGRVHIWFLDAAGKYASGANVADVDLVTAWQIKGVADMNRDGSPDLVWHHGTTGRVHIWFLDAAGKYVSGANVADVNLATSWRLKAVADVNTDGNPDLVWHNSSTGRAHIWFLDGVGKYVSGANALDTNLATTWQIDSVSY